MADSVLTASVQPDLGDPGESADGSRLGQAAQAFREALSVLTEHGPTASVITAGRNLGYLGKMTGRWQDAADGYQSALDASDARYRESLQLEARYDELTEVTDLPIELAAALASHARNAESAQAAEPLLQRAVAAIENGRMRLIGDLMKRDQAALEELRTTRPALHEAYRAAAARVRELDTAQWAQFELG
jgi:hypothetical protein